VHNKLLWRKVERKEESFRMVVFKCYHHDVTVDLGESLKSGWECVYADMTELRSMEEFFLESNSDSFQSARWMEDHRWYCEVMV
jgi:hypothetical protein